MNEDGVVTLLGGGGDTSKLYYVIRVVSTFDNLGWWGHKNLVYTVLTPLAPDLTPRALLTPALAHLCPCRVTPLTPLAPVLTSFTYPCTCPCTLCICNPTVCDHPRDVESVTDYNSRTCSDSPSLSHVHLYSAWAPQRCRICHWLQLTNMFCWILHLSVLWTSTVCDHPSDAESVTDFNSQTHSAGFYTGFQLGI